MDTVTLKELAAKSAKSTDYDYQEDGRRSIEGEAFYLDQLIDHVMEIVDRVFWSLKRDSRKGGIDVIRAAISARKEKIGTEKVVFADYDRDIRETVVVDDTLDGWVKIHHLEEIVDNGWIPTDWLPRQVRKAQ